MKNREYTVSFTFNCLNKRSMISRKGGEMDITTNAPVDELKKSDELLYLIAQDMAQKTKQTILSVDITDIRQK